MTRSFHFMAVNSKKACKIVNSHQICYQMSWNELKVKYHTSLKCVSPCIQVVLVDLEALVAPAVKSSEPVDSHKTTAEDDCTPDTRLEY